MNPSWLVESANLWGFHGAMLADAKQPMQESAVLEYWVRNRVRFDAWNATMRDQAWGSAEIVIREILLAEPLSRVCAAIAMRLEDRHVDADSRAVLHNVFTSHQDLRQRGLRWMLEGIDAGNEAAQHLNRLRSYLEHWTDMLLGFFADPASAEEYAFCSERVAEFSDEYSYRRLGDSAETVWILLLAGNRKWLNTHCPAEMCHPQLSQGVCQAALGMVHPLWFDSLGLLPSKAAQSIHHGLNFVDRTLESLVDGTWVRSSQVQASGANRFSA